MNGRSRKSNSENLVRFKRTRILTFRDDNSLIGYHYKILYTDKKLENSTRDFERFKKKSKMTAPRSRLSLLLPYSRHLEHLCTTFKKAQDTLLSPLQLSRSLPTSSPLSQELLSTTQLPSLPLSPPISRLNPTLRSNLYKVDNK